MKKMILSVMLLVIAATVTAQETKNATQTSLWLTEFSEVNISGPFTIVFEQIGAQDAPRISYDLKGSYTSKFRAEVKDNVLIISEKFESNRTSVTEITVGFHSLDKIRISGATVSFASPLKSVMSDVEVGAGAVVTMPVEVTDLKVDVSGKSSVILSGDARYLTLGVSMGKVDAAALKVMAAVVSASNKAEVNLNVTERIESKASTGARISYSGAPAIVRSGISFTGGNIVKKE